MRTHRNLQATVVSPAFEDVHLKLEAIVSASCFPRESSSHAFAIPGLLLTGGSSSRMGRDKALVEVEGSTMVDRTATALSEVCSDVLEVGPGFSNNRWVLEEPRGSGPLSAIVAGWSELGRPSNVLVLAVDMPFVSGTLLQCLGDYRVSGVVMASDGFMPQPLCARWTSGALEVALTLCQQGARSMRALMDLVDYHVLEIDNLSVIGIDVAMLRDIDAPSDLTC